ncbi:hypothetical protein A6769_10175 [Nostoc punctiforme NIES-2108]|uniref:CopG family transcriptional regulator n=1 Tax=Nostoc punctiforme NIES-2108 TaxID=1356359 RepID=A0A367RQW4_NOSPU|nr:hypothetical protein A6769_10175 [Nostoc punctiforme NIES-2108]
MKVKQLAIRLDQGTYDWLADQAIKSQKTMSDVARGIFEANQMTEGTRRAYGECLEYLASVDSNDFLVGLDALVEAIKEVKTNG